MKDTAHETIKADYSLLPQSLAATANKGSAVDCQGFGEALVVIPAGEVTSNGSHVFKVQESDTTTDGDFEDITSAAFTAITTANDNAVYVGRLNLANLKRYIRVVDTGSAQVMEGAALVILLAAAVLPVEQLATVAFDI